MADTKVTWLQCTIPAPEWEAINERRQRLGLKWNALIRPAVLAYLDSIERSKVEPQATEQETTTMVATSPNASEAEQIPEPAKKRARKAVQTATAPTGNVPTQEPGAKR